MLNARLHDALMRTADVVEGTDRYEFGRCYVPRGSDPGCLLGLLGQQLGHRPGVLIEHVARDLGVRWDSAVFYHRMENTTSSKLPEQWGGWTRDKRLAAAGLRKLAAEYAPEPVGA